MVGAGDDLSCRVQVPEFVVTWEWETRCFGSELTEGVDSTDL